MSDMELLRTYRSLAEEAAMLEQQLDAADAGRDRRALGCLLAEVTDRRNALQAGFEAVVRRAPTARLRQILRQYYGMAVTDAVIAESLGLTPKAVNKQRNKFVHMAEAD